MTTPATPPRPSDGARTERRAWWRSLLTPHAGHLFVHAHRESGEHRTLVLRPDQVRLLRALTSRWGVAALAAFTVSWGYFAWQAARIPALTARLAALQDDAQRLDTLQARLTALQSQYEQVQRLLTAPAPTDPSSPAPPVAATGSPEGGRP